METTSSAPHNRLIDYLVLVGPGHSVTLEPVPPPGGAKGCYEEPLQSWNNITTPVPSILRQFPPNNHPKCELPRDVVYFCQPEGCCIELCDPKTHVFMLTDTETNRRTFGVCLTIPHLFDPQPSTAKATSGFTKSEPINIQEWGVLSICILSHHPFLNFFAKCLNTLSHFVEHFGSNELTWNEILRARSGSEVEPGVGVTARKGRASKRQRKKSMYIAEFEDWIGNLLRLPAPEPGQSVLGVELEVEPEVFVYYPPKNRLPLFDLHIHHMFQKVGVHLVIEIFKLVLSEQKVILHAQDPAFSSECVLNIITLLYPLQYLYPVIPLLPSSMPTAENLLMVPTPYLIGVCDGFMKKVQDYQIAETWTVGLDTKQIKKPVMLDQPLLDFPYSILQLQADIRKALDKTQELEDLVSGIHQSTSSSTLSASPNRTSSLPRTMPPLLGEDYPPIYEVDTAIRIAFVQFLFDPELLGVVDQHLCIYRLFPRPVVTLRNHSFLTAYKDSLSVTDTTFIQNLIRTQCVEYFFQYSLNPSNSTFEEIRKGVTDTGRLGDKIHYSAYKEATNISQFSLISHSADSLLYQDMLSYKASIAQGKDMILDDSDWEVLSGDNYDGDSETSSMSGFLSDGDNNDNLTPVPSSTAVDNGRVDFLKNGYLDDEVILRDDIEVSYHTPRQFSKGFVSNQATAEMRAGSQLLGKEGTTASKAMLPSASKAYYSDDYSMPYFTPPGGGGVVDAESSPSSSSEVEATHFQSGRKGKDGEEVRGQASRASVESELTSSNSIDFALLTSSLRYGNPQLARDRNGVIASASRTAQTSNAQYVSQSSGH